MVTVDRERIMAAVHIDHLFTAYQIEMTPEEGVTFVEVAPLAGAPSTAKLSALLNAINEAIPPIDFGPVDTRTGRPPHSIIVGRQRGQRILAVSLFEGFFQPDYDFDQLVETICAFGQEAGARVATETEGNSESVVMRWGEVSQ